MIQSSNVWKGDRDDMPLSQANIQLECIEKVLVYFGIMFEDEGKSM